MDEPMFQHRVGKLGDLIAEGHIRDVSVAAARAGYSVPVMLSQAVWELCVEWTDEDTKHARLADLFHFTAFALLASHGAPVKFPLACVPQVTGELALMRLAARLVFARPRDALIVITLEGETIVPEPTN